MKGMNAETGKAITDKDLLAQSIHDILMTPIGTRVMNRDYGSLIFDLIDHPANAANHLVLYAVAFEALARWEPRIVLTRMQILVSDTGGGEFIFQLDGLATEDVGALSAGTAVQLTVPVGGSA